MNPNMETILNTLFRRASVSPASTQAAGLSLGSSQSAAAGPSTSLLPNFDDYLSQHGSAREFWRRFNLIPSKPSLGQDEYFHKVLGFLQDKKVGKVGIYGMGGVGKTTLLYRIHNEYLAFSDFDFIMWIPLHKEVDYENIWKLIVNPKRVNTWFYFSSVRSSRYFHNGEFQHILLDKITSDHPNKRNAIELYKFLCTKKFVLVMDNVWEYVDLEELGIPNPTEENMCKIIFTTRSEEVCRSMHPDAEIKVQCLGRSDSWALFQKNVGDKALNSDPLVHYVAEQVVEECGGLPLAIITVGRAMSGRYNRERWDNALALLRSYPHEFQCIEKKLYQSLKFSYDALENETIKQCFLYCSLFPEGYDINKEKLVQYWIGEGYLGDESLKNLKNAGNEIIRILQAMCLLECASEIAREVKMHDVIRDMALWIVSGYGKEKDRFFVHQISRELAKPMLKEKWCKAHKIFVMDLVDLPDQPPCPNLSTLLFGENISQINAMNIIPVQRVSKKSSDLPPPSLPPSLHNLLKGLFNDMPCLRVLELFILRIPPKISLLVALRYLRGSPIELSDISVGSLVNLMFLYLTGPFIVGNICDNGLGQLTELRELNLEGCDLNILPMELGGLTKLESLVLGKFTSELPSTIGQLIELRELNVESSHLRSLPLEIGTLSNMEIFIVRKSQIRMLPISIGGLTKLKILDLKQSSISTLPNTIGLLSELRELNLSHSKLEELSSQVGNLIKLKTLHLDSAGSIHCLPPTIGLLIELRELTLRNTRLATLPVELGSLKYLWKLDLTCTKIRELPNSIGQLFNLTYLYLEGTKLENLPQTIGHLVNLRYLNLKRTKLKTLPTEMGCMTKLRYLNLSHSDIEDLPNTMGKLVSLMYLRLQRTNLKTLPAEVGGMTELEVLNLSYTDITELPKTMGQLVNLENLDLRGTNLKTIPTELDGLIKLKIIT